MDHFKSTSSIHLFFAPPFAAFAIYSKSALKFLENNKWEASSIQFEVLNNKFFISVCFVMLYLFSYNWIPEIIVNFACN